MRPAPRFPVPLQRLPYRSPIRAVDSMTTSSTSHSTSQSASARNSAGGLSRPSGVETGTRGRPGRLPPPPPTSSCAHLLVHIDSRNLVSHRPLLGERRACLVALVRVASCRRFSPEDPTTPNYSVNHARSGSISCSASMAPLARFDLAAPASAILDCTRFSSPFAGCKPRLSQLRQSSSVVGRLRGWLPRLEIDGLFAVEHNHLVERFACRIQTAHGGGHRPAVL
jgi:hypothetical protein